MEKSFDNKIYMVAAAVEPDAGGVTQGILNRSLWFAKAHNQVGIITMNDEVKSLESRNELLRLGRINEDIEWLNIYDYYRQKSSEEPSTKRNIQQLIKNKLIENLAFIKFTHDTIPLDKIIRIDYHKRHVLKKRKFFDEQGRLLRITYVDKKGRPTLHKLYNGSGYQYRLVKVSTKTREVIYDKRFSPDGYCYMKREKNEKDWKINLFNRNEKKLVFNNVEEFQYHWLEEIVKSQNKKPILIIDSMALTNVCLKIDASAAFRVFSIRMNHFIAPTYDNNSPIDEDFRLRLENIENMDSLVVTTKAQAKDIKKQFKTYGKLSIIPNSVGPTTIDRKNNRNPNQVLMVTRLSPEKQVDHAIIAFSMVVKLLPDAKLIIYGSGTPGYTGDCKKLIHEYGLEKNVKLAGFINGEDLERAYAQSIMSIMTSKSEGFGRTIVESMLHGTPVVSYDINYGPKSIISDKRTGFLIRKDSVEDMANTIVELLMSPNKTSKIGKNARKDVLNKYIEAIEMRRWINLIDELISRGDE